MVTAVQERAKVAINKAEQTIRELEQTVESMPSKPEKIGSPWLLGAALGSIVFSIALFSRNRKEDALFVGLWAPTFLALDLFEDRLKLRRKT